MKASIYVEFILFCKQTIQGREGGNRIPQTFLTELDLVARI